MEQRDGTQVTNKGGAVRESHATEPLDPKLRAVESVRRRRVRCTQKAEPYCTMTISASTQTLRVRGTLHNRGVGQTIG